jgi:hypothetical protein
LFTWHSRFVNIVDKYHSVFLKSMWCAIRRSWNRSEGRIVKPRFYPVRFCRTGGA